MSYEILRYAQVWCPAYHRSATACCASRCTWLPTETLRSLIGFRTARPSPNHNHHHNHHHRRRPRVRCTLRSCRSLLVFYLALALLHGSRLFPTRSRALRLRLLVNYPKYPAICSTALRMESLRVAIGDLVVSYALSQLRRWSCPFST